MFLIFDCETSGFITPNYAFNHPKQGRILQLAALLLDEKFNEMGSFSSYIRVPMVLEIHPKAFETNGITNEICNRFGVPIELAVCMLDGFHAQSRIQIAHNAKFDIGMIQHEETAYMGDKHFEPTNVYCTMELMTPICQLQHHNGKSGYKWPKLEEAYNHLFPNQTSPQFHDALQDCRATAKIFKYLWQEGFIKEKDTIEDS